MLNSPNPWQINKPMAHPVFIRWALVTTLFLLLFALFSSADPQLVQVSAQGGNTTELLINATQSLDRWQGFFGNISGRVVLEDANNYSMYTWSETDTNVAGEVYAATQTVSAWSQVYCANL